METEAAVPFIHRRVGKTVFHSGLYQQTVLDETLGLIRNSERFQVPRFAWQQALNIIGISHQQQT